MNLLSRELILESIFEWKPQYPGGEVVVQVGMCTMSRLRYLPWTMSCLESQDERRIRLFIWNNNPKISKRLEQVIKQCRPSFPVTIVHSRRNIGGLGRFLLVKHGFISNATPVVFIDDDQLLMPNLISELIRRWRPLVVTGWWAWRFISNQGYWNRERCEDGSFADYIGTGGMICNPEIFSHRKFFEGLPQQFSGVEDLWLSYFASHVMGNSLIAAPDLIRQVKDGKDQYIALRDKKDVFLEWLRTKGEWYV